MSIFDSIDGHGLDFGKKKLGSRSYGRGSAVWGTTGRCDCGEKFSTNESPTKGGRDIVEGQWRDHVGLEPKPTRVRKMTAKSEAFLAALAAFVPVYQPENAGMMDDLAVKQSGFTKREPNTCEEHGYVRITDSAYNGWRVKITTEGLAHVEANAAD